MIRRCPSHGAFEAEACPVCEHPGDPLIGGRRRVQVSKFLSGALRHFPEDVGLEVDARGWVPLADLIEAACDELEDATAPEVRAVLALDPKGRFDIEDDRVRGAYGHSIDVEVDAEHPDPVPERLYHGTPPRNLEAILEEGLRPRGRREVHLSPDRATAREVALRHGDRARILAVDVEGLREAGIEVHRRAESVYTCERVPPEHLEVLWDRSMGPGYSGQASSAW